MSEATETLYLGTTKRRLDIRAVEDGVAYDCPIRPGLVVTIRPAAMFNPHFRRALTERVQRIAETNGGDSVEHTSRYRDSGFVAEALVAHMGPLKRADGTEVDYTPEIGRAVLADPGNADVLEWISNTALDDGRYYTAEVEEEEKNS